MDEIRRMTGCFGAPVAARVFHSIPLDETVSPYGAQP